MKTSRSALLALVLAAAACFGPGQAKRYFDFQTGPVVPAADGQALGKVLYVDRVDVEDLWNDFRIIYRRSATELNYYPYEFWAEKPDKLLRDTIYHYLQARRVFGTVSLDADRETPDWVLRCRVYRLEEFDLADVWGARLAMDMVVADSRTGQVIGTRTFDRTLPLGRKSVAELPIAISRILTEELELLLRDVRRKGTQPD